jgi:phospholipid-binding lipoprotein MlaA
MAVRLGLVGGRLQHFRLAAILSLCVWTAACSAAPEAVEQNDPFEPLNRQIFEFNHGLDHRVALPVASFYRSVAPAPFREHLHYFLTNLNLPVTFANDVLQGHFSRSGEAIGRFAVNSTLGVGGVFDVATDWGMPYHREDFGQTMGYYGVGEGPYLVVPLAGPALPRDIAGTVVDGYINPLGYIQWRNKNYYWSWPIRVLSLMDSRSHNIDALREMERSSIDLYATTRSIYRQSREAEIRNGVPDVAGLPDF